jgi:hypothetical protein
MGSWHENFQPRKKIFGLNIRGHLWSKKIDAAAQGFIFGA